MSERTIFATKYTGETKKLTFDFISDLAIGETVDSATVTATVYSGTDAAPSAIINGAASISGTIVTQSITAGTAGVIYTLLCTISTSLSQTLGITACLTVEST